MHHQRLGDILLTHKHIDAPALATALASAQESKTLLGNYLIERMGFSEEIIYQALAEQNNLPFLIDIENQVHEETLRELPIQLFNDGRCFPLKSSETTITCALSDPLDFDRLMALEAASGMLIQATLTTPSAMQRAHLRWFGEKSRLSRSVGTIAREYEKNLMGSEQDMSLEEIRKRTESEPVVKMASLIIDEAIRQAASDIHIEPRGDHAIVRYRVDGMLQQAMELAPTMYVPLTSRIKIMADLDIAEKRMPQDGSIRFAFSGNDYDLRISTLPTLYGEKTVVRILKHDISLLDIDNLGIPAEESNKIAELIDKPQGILFVTGPTGSGKSSSLFACLNRIRTKAINIITIENPIEYKLDGLNQVQINEKAGVTFATTLRSILRQDPDVILIGEIRDQETAHIAIQASQTGHLVFSTLHTNDAVAAISRLRDLDIQPFLIASSLIGILAQRLVRVLCPACKQKQPVSDEIRRRWNILLGDTPLPASYSAVGCEQCKKTGYKGRTGIFELVYVNEALRDMITKGESEIGLRQHLRSHGFKSMIQNGIDKIEQGITTPEELLRVVLVEDTV